MAFPIDFDDPNASFLAKDRKPYPIHIRDYKFGQNQTVQALSFWRFSQAELDQIKETGVVFFRFVGGQPPICVINADPTEFEGQGPIYKHPDCIDLPTFARAVVFDGKQTFDVTSAWKLNSEGLRDVLERGWIILIIVGGQCDCDVFGINPIE